ncbi:hypothetical protein HDU97_000362 [Phlyctochytrium planicorne]|nr:hypothetical protein HDU97_000362 [Phlyctochytrium planicorne]
MTTVSASPVESPRLQRRFGGPKTTSTSTKVTTTTKPTTTAAPNPTPKVVKLPGNNAAGLLWLGKQDVIGF